jgi:hypothetical protein
MENKYLSKLIELKKMGQKHKSAIFDLKEKFAEKKFELLKKQHEEKADLWIKHLEEKVKTGCTPELTKKLILDKLHLCEKFTQEWSDLCEEKEHAFEALAEKSKKDREQFKKGL